MNRKWFYHPVVIFIFSVVALATSLFLYIYWYIGVSRGLKAVIEKYRIDPGQIFEISTWVVILVLSLLVGVILVGIFIIFAYYQKMWQLYRLQRNFLNNFTHELKTPVTSLKLYLDTFMTYNLPREEQIKYLRFMMQDVERLLNYINRILSLTKIERGRYWKEFKVVNFVEVIREFYRRNEDLFPNCVVRFHDELVTPFYYPINLPLFEMLLMNVMTNAVQYNDSEKPEVDIRIIAGKKKVHVQFADNGVGIEKSELKKIFRMFYQIGNPENVTARGSGLGLYIAAQVAKIHKGKLTAWSEGRGRGSVFTLTLPLRGSQGC